MTETERNEALSQFLDDLADITIREEDNFDAPDGVFPDGRYYDWDDRLNAVIETAPDGRRYVVQFRKGQLVRLREYLTSACAD